MITVSKLAKSYRGKPVLQPISAAIRRSGLTSLIGPNGAGKSTLLMLMAGLLEPSGGEICLDGRPLGDFPPRDYARRVATLRQSSLFDLRLKVEELVAFGRFPHGRGRLAAADHEAIDRALALLSLEDLRKRYIDELSGGQRQMALLAMTIAQETDCLLLDEPLNNLDMQHAVQVMEVLRTLCDSYGRTVVVVIHDINFAANYSDHMIALKDGKLVAEGQTGLIVTERHLQALYNLDFEILTHGGNRLCNYFTPRKRI
ncbi:ABC transporter ATP-binding protein [Leisingera sp.]|uniref:iron ABC transporter ATP-binding protein n=1 Tax=Leisingera sp. TaxID=1879318 RepID=UPI002B27A448|nr:ATP-binding cassette domain-containing protein [Leisingera sp.]